MHKTKRNIKKQVYQNEINLDRHLKCRSELPSLGPTPRRHHYVNSDLQSLNSINKITTNRYSKKSIFTGNTDKNDKKDKNCYTSNIDISCRSAQNKHTRNISDMKKVNKTKLYFDTFKVKDGKIPSQIKIFPITYLSKMVRLLRSPSLPSSGTQFIHEYISEKMQDNNTDNMFCTPSKKRKDDPPSAFGPRPCQVLDNVFYFSEHRYSTKEFDFLKKKIKTKRNLIKTLEKRQLQKLEKLEMLKKEQEEKKKIKENELKNRQKKQDTYLLQFPIKINGTHRFHFEKNVPPSLVKYIVDDANKKLFDNIEYNIKQYNNQNREEVKKILVNPYKEKIEDGLGEMKVSISKLVGVEPKKRNEIINDIITKNTNKKFKIKDVMKNYSNEYMKQRFPFKKKV